MAKRRPTKSLCTLSFFLLFYAALGQKGQQQQRLAPGDGEQLKAQLLANLNKYGDGGTERARDGPLEPFGAREGSPPGIGPPAAAPNLLPVFPGLPELLALLKPPQPVPVAFPSPATPVPVSIMAGFEERRHKGSSSREGSSHSTGGKSAERRWRKAAEVVGNWRRKMYKVFKSVRRKGRTGTEQPVFLFGPPPLMKRGDKLAQQLFGVDNLRRSAPLPKKANNTAAENRRGRKHLHSKELRRPVTTTAAPSDDWDIYGDELKELEDEEQFEIVYVPALKRSGAHGRRTEGVDSTDQQGEGEELEGPAPVGRKAHRQEQNSSPSFVPSIPTATAPSPPIIPPAVTPIVASPSSLPLQFPTLLPPLVSFTLPPALGPPPLATSTAIAAIGLPERELLRELENVPEDYVDEQERRLPCLDRPAAASAACKRMRSRPAPEVGVQSSLLDEQFPWDENRDMCNSARLRALIQQSIVPSSVEKSKRALQQRAEAQFGAFYNVVCGTGFFSYIAHTDEFCLVAVQDMHCYVFSPVCASQLSLASGIARQRLAGMQSARRQLRAGQKRHFLNRN